MIESLFISSYSNECTGVQNPHCLIHACMIHVHDVSIAYLTVYTIIVPDRTIATYPTPEQGSGTVFFRVSACWGKIPGYITIIASVTY